MFKVSVDASKVKQYLGGLIGKTEESITDEAESMMLDIQRQMKVEGKPVTYPIQWDSERQRRFVMAKLRAENNLPYKRIGAYQRGWTVTKLPDGYSLSNTHPAGAIGGTLNVASGSGLGGGSFQSWQSRIHRGRWPALMPIVLQALVDLPKRVIERLKVKANK